MEKLELILDKVSGDRTNTVFSERSEEYDPKLGVLVLPTETWKEMGMADSVALTLKRIH